MDRFEFLNTEIEEQGGCASSNSLPPLHLFGRLWIRCELGKIGDGQVSRGSHKTPREATSSSENRKSWWKEIFSSLGRTKDEKKFVRGLFARHPPSAFGTETIDSLNFYREICHFLERKKEKMESASKDPIFRLPLLLLSSLPLFRFDFRSRASGKLIRPFLFRGNERVGGSISRLDIDSGFLESRNTNEEKREKERGTCDERVFRGSCSHVKYLSEDSKIRQTTRWNKRRRNLFLSLPRFFRKAVQRRSRGQTPGFSTAPVFD